MYESNMSVDHRPHIKLTMCIGPINITTYHCQRPVDSEQTSLTWLLIGCENRALCSAKWQSQQTRWSHQAFLTFCK